VNVLVVDTSAWISYFKGKSCPDLDLALKESRVYLPSIVIAELLSARLKSVERKDLSNFLIELPLCDHSFEHWARVGELRANLAAKGLHVSTPDAHVAQSTLDLEGYLLTEDSIFKKIGKSTRLRVL
jgi:predicted nucleic acid-binding protein